MKTHYALIEQMILEASYIIRKLDEYWQVMDGEIVLFQNRRKGELLAQVEKEMGL